jgi:hypothetical protein
MAHQTYANFVLGNKMNDILTTKVNLNNYMTIDTSLTENAGATKKVVTYNSTGNVEQLAMGKGNTEEIEVTNTVAEYNVLTYQGKFAFYDEEEMADPMVVETGLTHSAQSMVNTFTANAIAEFEKATLAVSGAWGFDLVVDAIAKMNVEAEEGLFLLVSPTDLGAIRKALKDQLQYSEGFVRTGYVGSIAGVPVIVTKAVAPGKAYLATKEAVTVFIKKDTETEYGRDGDTRKNTYWVRKHAIVALTDGSKVVKITINA